MNFFSDLVTEWPAAVAEIIELNMISVELQMGSIGITYFSRDGYNL